MFHPVRVPPRFVFYRGQSTAAKPGPAPLPATPAPLPVARFAPRAAQPRAVLTAAWRDPYPAGAPGVQTISAIDKPE